MVSLPNDGDGPGRVKNWCKMRAVQCPSDITDQIGGWTTDGVGQGYGLGYPIRVLQEWLEKAA